MRVSPQQADAWNQRYNGDLAATGGEGA